MHRERVSENVFWFQSEVYAQVTAGVVAVRNGAGNRHACAADETLGMREFIEHEIGVPVRYVINTHYTRITLGELLLPWSHGHRARALSGPAVERGYPSLEAASKQNPALRQVKIICTDDI